MNKEAVAKSGINLCSDLLSRSLSKGRARMLHRAAASIGRSSYEWQRTGDEKRYLDMWVNTTRINLLRSAKWRAQARDAILDWHEMRCSFYEGRERLTNAIDMAEVEDLTTGELLALRTLVGTVGFFTLTERLLDRAILRSLRDFDRSPNRWSARNAFTGALLQGNLEGSSAPLKVWIQSGRPDDLELVEKFLHICRNPRLIKSAGASVTVIGPGPVGELGPFFNSNSPICRVVMPGVTNWSNDDIVDGRVTFGYLNGHSTEWLTRLSQEERDSIVRSFEGLRIKKMTEWEHAYSSVRQVRRMHDLFLTGSPNMVPTIIMDLLTEGTEHVYVTGTSFFVGAEPYRPSERREFYEVSKVSDSFGAINNGTFERCYSHSSHDQIVNRGIIRLLYDAGYVSGDSLFVSALLMSDAEYLLELENSYGANRR